MSLALNSNYHITTTATLVPFPSHDVPSRPARVDDLELTHRATEANGDFEEINFV